MTNRSKVLIPLALLLIWAILITLFGFLSHFSLAGAVLFIQGFAFYVYEHVKGSHEQRSRRLASIVGMVCSALNMVNAFYLESSSIALKALTILFCLACMYMFVGMAKRTSKSTSTVH